MSKLEELIARLCPDGVEYKPFVKIARYIRGVTYNKSQEINDGREGFKLLRANNIDLSTNTLNFNDVKVIDYSCKIKENQFLKKDDILICAGSGSKEHIGKVAFIDGDMEYTFGGFMGIIRTDDSIILPRLMFHILTSTIFKTHLAKVSNSSTINNINNDTWKSFMLPVPPLEVQREIVHVLDSFTFLTAELTAELAAELAARQKQYEFYRDALLTFKNIDDTILNERTNELELSGIVRWMKFGDSCELKAGKAIPALYISSECNEEYNYPCYGGNGLRGYVREYNNVGCHPLVGRQGALCGNVCYAGDNFYATEHAIVVTPKDVYNPRFLYYLLKVAKLEQYKTAGAQPGLSVARLEKIELPVPPLSEQQRIVDILDRFDALCNDITSGLPAEIEARQKQYEYYRDKLLTFKELKKEA